RPLGTCAVSWGRPCGCGTPRSSSSWRTTPSSTGPTSWRCSGTPTWSSPPTPPTSTSFWRTRTEMLTTREAAQLLERQDNILILTHRRPDGDTIGCAAGLCAALRLRGKEAYILPNPDVT